MDYRNEKAVPAKRNRELLRNLWTKIRESRYFYAGISLLLLLLGSSLLSSSFMTLDNMITILRQSSILLMLSMGLTAVILTGNIDLSVGAVAGLAGCICARLMTTGFGIIPSMFAGIMIGLLTGLVNGFLVGTLKLPSFVVTYGTSMVISGLANIVMNGGVIYGLPEHFTAIGIGYVGIIPVPVIISGVVLLLMALLLYKTTFGRNIYMIGYNMNAARYSAGKDLQTLLAAYILCGLTGALGGIMMTARLNAADAGMSSSYGLQIVAAVVVGGTSLLGGEGGIFGTWLGAVILTAILNIMNMCGVDASWQNFVIGMVILGIVWLDIFPKYRAGRRKSA